MEQRRTHTQRDHEERVLRVLEHIHKNLDDEFDLEVLAAVACFSPFHFHRVFCGMVGEPVKGYVRRLRLERAAMQLKSSDEQIIQIALGAGYETPESFTRAFRRRFDVSPREYRRAHKEAAPSGVYYSPEDTVVNFNPLPMENAMNARIETLQPLTVAFVRHTGPYDQVGAAWQKVYGWAGPKGLLGPETRALGISYDDPDVTPAEKIRYDACITVEAGTQAEGGIGVKNIDGWKYAVATHSGAYSKMGETYGRLLGQWMPAEDLEPQDGQPCIEVYRNTPQDTAEEELRTDIYVPIKDGAVA